MGQVPHHSPPDLTLGRRDDAVPRNWPVPPHSGNVIRAMGKDVSDPDLLTRVLRGSCRPAEMKGDREEGRHDEVTPELQEKQEGVPQGEGVSKGPKLLGRRASQLPPEQKRQGHCLE